MLQWDSDRGRQLRGRGRNPEGFLLIHDKRHARRLLRCVDRFLRKRVLIHPAQGARFRLFEQGPGGNAPMQA